MNLRTSADRIGRTTRVRFLCDQLIYLFHQLLDDRVHLLGRRLSIRKRTHVVRKPASAMPLWAVLERQLIALMNHSEDFLRQHYLQPDGRIFWPDLPGFRGYGGVDNVFEGFHRWPLFYLLGGEDSDEGWGTQAGVFATPLRALANFNSLVAVVKRELPAINVPSLIMHPRHDDMADIDNAYFLQRRLPGRVELVVLDDSYHIITLDRQRNVVVERSIEFGHSVTAQANPAVAEVKPIKFSAAE